MALRRQSEYTAYETTARDESGRSIPLSVHEPKNPPTTTPEVIVISNGWATGRGSLKVPAEALARSSIVLTFDHDRVSDSDPTKRKTAALAAVAEAAITRFGGKVTIRAYSEGLLHAARYARQNPQAVARIEAVKGFGLAPTTVEGLCLRIADELKQLPRMNAVMARAALFCVDYVARNPGLALHEMFTLASDDVLPDVAAVLELGIPVSALFGDHDKLSPADESISRLSRLRHKINVGRMGIGHLNFLYDPNVSAAVSSLRRPAGKVKAGKRKAA